MRTTIYAFTQTKSEYKNNNSKNVCTLNNVYNLKI